MGNSDTHLERPGGRAGTGRSDRLGGSMAPRSAGPGFAGARRAPPLGTCRPLEVHAQRRADPLSWAWHAAHLFRAPDALAACPWSWTWLLAAPARGQSPPSIYTVRGGRRVPRISARLKVSAGEDERK